MSQSRAHNQSQTGLRRYSVEARHSGSKSQTLEDAVAEEVAAAIVYNGVTHAVMMLSPTDLEDFAVGFSLTEGVIDHRDDIQAIDIDHTAQGLAIQIQIASTLSERLRQRQRSLAGRAGCGICGLTELAAIFPTLPSLNAQTPPTHQAVDHAVTAMLSAQSMQQACGGVHGAAYCNADGEVLLVREDIGRHNALDKLIGAMQPQTRSDCDFVLMSSRASLELVNKTVIAGIHSLVTLSAASSLAVDVARKAKLNLIGFVRDQRQLIYHQN